MVAASSLPPGAIVLAEHAVACVAAAGRSLCDDCLTSIDRRVGFESCCISLRLLRVISTHIRAILRLCTRG